MLREILCACYFITIQITFIQAQPILINEFHYDNIFTDDGEFIEIAAPSGTLLDGYELIIYDGSEGTQVFSIDISGSVTNDFDGYGFATFSTFLPNTMSGIALVDSSSEEVLQFLSYEGEFTATNGPAAGMTSQNIGVKQSANGDIGTSLYATGTGCVDREFFGDFEWAGPDLDTRGGVNIGQTFLSCPTPSPTTSPTSSSQPSISLSEEPTKSSSKSPTGMPTGSMKPSSASSINPTLVPSSSPSNLPTSKSSTFPSSAPTLAISTFPSLVPSLIPSLEPTLGPTISSPPSSVPTLTLSSAPSAAQSLAPSTEPTIFPTFLPSTNPSGVPTMMPSSVPTNSPIPSMKPTTASSSVPSQGPSHAPTMSSKPTHYPSTKPTLVPSSPPTSLCSSSENILNFKADVSTYNNTRVAVCNAYVTDIVYNGFFIQDLPEKNSGIFVLSGMELSLNRGDIVDIYGILVSTPSMLQLINTQQRVVGTEHPPTHQLVLPLQEISTFDEYQGMFVELVPAPGYDIVVSDLSNLESQGEVIICAVNSTLGRIYHFTQLNEPNVDGFIKHQSLLERSCITIDDNSDILNPDPIRVGDIYPITSEFTCRIGTKVLKLQGSLWFSSNKYKITTSSFFDLIFDQSTSIRQDVPILSLSETSTIIAVTNLNNYWKTDDFRKHFSGSDTQEVLERQAAKTVSALNEMNADVYALVGMEQGPESSTDLRNRMNCGGKSLQSAYINNINVFLDNEYVRNARSKCDVFYDTTKFNLEDSSLLQDESIPSSMLNRSTTGYIFNGGSLSPFAVTLLHKNTTNSLTIVVNDFVSRDNVNGSANGADNDSGDGAGYFNLMRTLSSEALIHWINTDSFFTKSDVIVIVGDMNSYKMESPITYLVENGFENMVGSESEYEYSYQSDCQFGTLDYALVSNLSLEYVSGAAIWNVNSNELDLIEYAADLDNATVLLNASIPERFSDHDVLLLSFDLNIMPTYAPIHAISQVPSLIPSQTSSSFIPSLTVSLPGDGDGDGDNMNLWVFLVAPLSILVAPVFLSLNLVNQIFATSPTLAPTVDPLSPTVDPLSPTAAPMVVIQEQPSTISDFFLLTLASIFNSLGNFFGLFGNFFRIFEIYFGLLSEYLTELGGGA